MSEVATRKGAFMRRCSTALAAVVTGLVGLGGLAGCAQAGNGGAAVTEAARPTGAEYGAAGAGERAAIFVAVLRRYLTTGDHSFGDEHRFAVAYVLDHTEAKVGDPTAGDPRGGGPGTMPMLEPITAAEQAQVRAALTDVGRVEFVRDRTDVVDSRNDCLQVSDGGVLIALGPPRSAPASAVTRPLREPATPSRDAPPSAQPNASGNAPRVHVGIHGYVACLAATWFTYVVERHGPGWRVIGTTGPMAIS